MRIHPGMKMLSAVVVLFLWVGTSDSVIVNKCELKQQLQTVITLPLYMSDVLAQIVCHVNLTSNFNTSTITTISEQEKPGETRGPRKVRSGKNQGKNKDRPNSKVTRPPHPESGEDKDELWTFYGLFQLSDQVACTSTRGPSLNLCRINCDNLLDDNISDDLACIQVIINKMNVISDHQIAKRIQKMISLIYQPECATVRASTYFADCP